MLLWPEYVPRLLLSSVRSGRRTMSSNSSNSVEKALVTTEKVGRTLLIGINRPQKRNCINHETAKQLVTAFEAFEKDETAWNAVLYGAGGNFCAGYDLKEASSMGAKIIDMIESQPGGFRMVGPTGMRFSKPIIAAIDGYAVAAGVELALMCDIRVVDETAKFGIFNRRFGVPLIDGGTIRLPQLIGFSRAMDMILSGREVDAKTAFEWGLANRLVPTGAALGQAFEYARTLEKFPQMCMNADRRSAYYATYEAQNEDDAFRYEWEKGKKVIEKESTEGATRFTQGIGRHGSFNLDRKS